MKTIGLIGGMSWESSKVYYEYINQLVSKKLGGVHSAKILMSSLDFAEIEKLTFDDDWGQIGAIVASHAKKLEDAGADMVVLCTNTIHLVKDQIEEAITVPFLHIAQAVGETIVSKNVKKVGLLGTKFTMEKDFYSKILEEVFGLEVVIPDVYEREVLQSIIYNELVKGKFTIEAKKQCLKIVEKLKQKGVEGVILGCTELPILIPNSDLDIVGFDTTKIHCEAAVAHALK